MDGARLLPRGLEAPPRQLGLAEAAEDLELEQVQAGLLVRRAGLQLLVSLGQYVDIVRGLEVRKHRRLRHLHQGISAAQTEEDEHLNQPSLHSQINIRT